MMKLNKYLKEIKNLQIHIIGASGTEGSEIACFLHKHKIQNVTLHDICKNQTKFEKSFFNSHKDYPLKTKNQKWNSIQKLKYKINYLDNYLDDIKKADLIFVPQSWFMHKINDPIKKLTKKITISSITRLYLELLPCKIIGITGSNGKSTTTFLTYHLLKQSPNIRAFLTGNDRQATQLLNQIETITSKDIVVTEISNRQLLTTDGLSPDIAIITNITENHLTEHASLKEYANVKSKIFKYQKANQHYFINNLDSISKNLKTKSKGIKHLYCHKNQDSAYYDHNFIYLKNKKFIAINNLNLKGEHNLQNICAAISGLSILKFPKKYILQGLKTFTGLKDRMQLVHQTKEIRFYNDRQGTSVESTIKAIQSTNTKNKILIFGGINKGMSTKKLIQTINNNQVICLGITSPFCNEIKNKITTTYQETKNLTTAIKNSYKIAKSLKQPVDIIFSPACEYGPYFNPKPEHADAENFNQIASSLSVQ